MHQAMFVIITNDQNEQLLNGLVDVIEQTGTLQHCSTFRIETEDTAPLACAAANVVAELLLLVDFILQNNAADPGDLATCTNIINEWAEKHRGNEA